MAARFHAALLLALAPACGACGPAAGAAGAPEDHAAPARPVRDPALAEVRAALEQGRGDLALEWLERVPGSEATGLRARAQFFTGDAVAALATLAQARADDPHQPELWAVEVELLANLGRRQGASELLATAFKRFGPAPALYRAQGVVELLTEGHAPQALEALERAQARDPELPFLAFPLAQAHLLFGRARLQAAPAEATAHARAARMLWPALLDARELEAEGLTGELRFEEALALYDELAAAGRDYGETPALLEQRCATRCLLEHDRAGAIAHYLGARRRGMDDAGLGFGLSVLAEEHAAALARGEEAAEAGDWERAAREFARALELVPGDLAAENHLGVARFQREEFRAAAEAWEHVLARGLASGIELPDPVALNLAKAWRLTGEAERARTVVSELLDREPEGPWSEAARELLLVLEAEALADR